jgi:ABC-type branched-subunit amino acid transport system ATPase component
MLDLIKKYCAPNSKEIFFLVFFSLLSSFFLILLPLFFSLILGLIRDNFNVDLAYNEISISDKSIFNLNYLYFYLNNLFNNYFIDISFAKKIFLILIFFLIISFLASLFRYISIYFTQVSELKTKYKIRLELKEKIFNFDYSYFKKLSSGSLSSVFMKDVDDISIISGSYMRAFATHISLIVLTLIFLFKTNILLSLILFFIFGLHYCYNLIFNKPIFFSTKEFYLKVGELTGKLQDLFNNFKLIKIFFAENKKKQLTKTFNDLNSKELKVKLLSSLQEPSRMLIDNFSVILIVSIVVLFIFLKKISLEGSILFLLFSKFAQAPISGLSTALLWTPTIKASYERIKNILSYEKKIIFGTNAINTFHKSLQFKNVDFGYDGNLILTNVNFEIIKNVHYIMVGKNGSGKSTIIDLILGLQEPSRGQILIDNIDIRNFQYRDYLNLFSLVTQDSFLINDTIEENILIGSQKKDIVKKDLEALIISLNADFIFNFPKGLKTIIDESGSSLSGGQKQKICIIRALINNPEIIIFDEVLSNQDEQSKNDIKNMIISLSKYKTIIEISHEKNYKKNDNILFIDNKQVNKLII